MSERCIDANVFLKLVLKGEPHRVTARRLIDDTNRAGVEMIAPPMLPFEIDSVIRKQVYLGKMTNPQARKAFGFLDTVPIKVLDHPRLRERARDIAEQFNQSSVYDASYAALADLHACDFWTNDTRFYDAVKSVLTFVKHLRDYP